jgi:membrane fusion protein (multidrug efflux system)
MRGVRIMAEDERKVRKGSIGEHEQAGAERQTGQQAEGGPQKSEEKSTHDSQGGGGKDQGKKTKKTRRWVMLVILAVIVIVGLIVGIPYYLYAISHVKTDDAFIDVHITSLSSRVAGHVWKLYVNDNQLVNEGDLILELDPRDFEARLQQAQAALSVASSQSESADINVSLTHISSYAALADANAAVELAASALDTASARLVSARSQLSQARADVDVARSSLLQSEAEVKAMQALYDRDHTDLKRYQQMYDTNSVTQQQLDHAIATAKVSSANLEAATKQTAVARAKVAQAESAAQTTADRVTEQEYLYAEAKSSLKEAKASLEAARAAPHKVAYSKSQSKAASSQAEQAKAALRQAQLQLSYTKIYAPVSGRVTHKTVELGDYIVQGQTLMAIVPSDIYVTANYKETDLTHMKPGQPAKITVDAYPGAVFRGYVDSIQAGSGATFSLLPPENATGNYIKVVQRIPVKIVFEQQPDQSKYYTVPGMSVIPEVDITYRELSPKGPISQPPYTSWIASHSAEDANSTAIPGPGKMPKSDDGSQSPDA